MKIDEKALDAKIGDTTIADQPDELLDLIRKEIEETYDRDGEACAEAIMQIVQARYAKAHQQPVGMQQTFTEWLAQHNDAFNAALKEFTRSLAIKPPPELGKVTKEQSFMSAMQTFSRYFYERPAMRETEQPVAWLYCPECGDSEYQRAYGGSSGERVCGGCGQSWWPDIDYTDVVRGHLADHKKTPVRESGWVRKEDFRCDSDTAPLVWWWNEAQPDSESELDEFLPDANGALCGKGGCGADYYTHVKLAGFSRPLPPNNRRRG